MIRTPQTDDLADIHLRFLVAVPRSGSTLFMRIMAGSEDVAVTSRLILMGNMRRGTVRGKSGRSYEPDYTVFDGPNCAKPHAVFAIAREMGNQIIVSKEEFGNDRTNGTYKKNECNFNLFRDNDAIELSKPVFLFRTPQLVFDSWLSKGWTDLRSFILSYQNLYNTYVQSKIHLPGTIYYTYEVLTENMENQINIISNICKYWDIGFSENMLQFTSEFGEEFVFWNEEEEAAYKKDNPMGIFDTVRKHDSVVNTIPPHGLITEQQHNIIEGELGEVYKRLRGPEELLASGHGDSR